MLCLTERLLLKYFKNLIPKYILLVASYQCRQTLENDPCYKWKMAASQCLQTAALSSSIPGGAVSLSHSNQLPSLKHYDNVSDGLKTPHPTCGVSSDASVRIFDPSYLIRLGSHYHIFYCIVFFHVGAVYRDPDPKLHHLVPAAFLQTEVTCCRTLAVNKFWSVFDRRGLMWSVVIILLFQDKVNDRHERVDAFSIHKTFHNCEVWQ